jgi:hypothetical protein
LIVGNVDESGGAIEEAKYTFVDDAPWLVISDLKIVELQRRFDELPSAPVAPCYGECGLMTGLRFTANIDPGVHRGS